MTIKGSIMIHQPHFFPWVPYMARVTMSDVFVVLDDLSYRRTYYQNRTKLIDVNGNLFWLTLPVDEKRSTSINRIKLANNCDWCIKKTIRTIKYNYSKSPFFDDYWEPVSKFLMRIGERSSELNLASANIESIKFMCSLLEIEPPIMRASSDLDVLELERTARIVEICRITGQKIFLTGWGAGLDPRVHNLQQLIHNGIKIKPLSKDALREIEPDFLKEGYSTLHWIFAKGSDYVKEHLLEYEHKLMEEQND